MHAYCQTQSIDSLSMAGASTLTNYSINATLFDAQIPIGGAGIVGRLVDPYHYYELELKAGPNNEGHSWYILKKQGTQFIPLMTGPLAPSRNADRYRLSMAFNGDRITAYVAYNTSDSYQILGSVTDQEYAAGKFGLRTWSTTTVSFQNVTVMSSAPGPTPMTETPLASDALADSVGVNTNVTYYAQKPDFSTVLSRLASLGVRHVRDGIVGSTSKQYDNAMAQMLTTANVKLDGVTDCPGIEYYPTSPTTTAAIAAFQTFLGGRIEYVESPNEPDNRGIAGWATDTVSCLPGLRSALPGVPFLAPSLANYVASAPLLGNLSQLVDVGNIHRYFSGNQPGGQGWGGTGICGPYGALTWALCYANMIAGPKPSIVTETGYNSQGEVDELTQAKYLSRLFFVNLQGGISHSYIYDLRDYSPVNTDGAYGDGLLRTDDSEKPAFSAISNLISYFADPSAPVAPAPLSYYLSTATLSHLLFQKNNGTYVLALWNETPSWNPVTKQEIAVAPTSVDVTLVGTPSSVSALSMSDTGAWTANSVALTGKTMTLSVDDHITLLTFGAN